RSSLRYQPKPANDDELRLAMIRLAKQYGRYGYRKVTALLRMEGWPPLGRFALQIACRAMDQSQESRAIMG
ncbi:MAG: IS3 family transposase, partial [Pseudomonadota bacterium]